jgi:serine phosphatase RsbU (regulator of sigma subunit)
MTSAAKDAELQRLHSQADALEHDIRDMRGHEHRQDTLIERLRREADVRDDELCDCDGASRVAEHELEDLRAIRDGLTPSQLPQRPGLQLAAAFVLAVEQVSGDFSLVAEGPQDSTVLVIGDVVGHGPQAARRTAFIRTAFAATAPFSDDPGGC